jgi:hypothetical protein
MWCVVYTIYEDDYKCRRGNWSETRGPFLFSTKERAEDYMCVCLRKHFEEEIEDYYISDGNNDELKEKMLENDGKVKDEYKWSYSDICGLVEPFLEGEFVPTKLEWTITQPQVDFNIAERSPLNKKIKN